MLITDVLEPSHGNACSESGVAGEASPHPPHAIPALPGIDCPAAVARLGDDPELYLMLVEEFVGSQSASTAELRTLLAEEHWHDAERVAHTTKGVAATVGATQLAALAKGLEDALHRGAPHFELLAHADAISAELARVVGHLQVLLAGGTPDPAAWSTAAPAAVAPTGVPGDDPVAATAD